MGCPGNGPANGTSTITTTKSTNQLFKWEEIRSRNGVDKKEKWLVIEGKVYDVTNFCMRHPGGSKIICSYAGQDATDPWAAMHPDKDMVHKYMAPLLVGSVDTCENGPKEEEIKREFRALRNMALKNDWFTTRPLFFLLHLLQIHAIEVATFLMFLYFGVNPVTFLIGSLAISTAQAEAGWAQHDYGHMSVFNTRALNKIGHEFVVGHLKGAASRWWNFRHNLHHCKPNIIKYDPDIDAPYLFLLGDKVPVEWGKKHRGFMPYNWQHDYFFFLGPPILLPLYFHYENVYFMLKRRDFRDLAWTISFFVKFFFIFNHIFDSPMTTFWFYMLARFWESHWFTMVTQMSHIPMDIDRDKKRNWLAMQLNATCNASSSWFNDWFTGHLNFQIEHHLFPDMPRHNYHLVKPYVERMCAKYNIPYKNKPLRTAFADVIRSLRKSGELWLEAYTNPG